MLQLKVKKARTGPKTISEKIHEQFAPEPESAVHSDEDEASRPRFSEFDENDDELERTAAGRLSDIRKKNIKYLDSIDRKYQGEVSSRFEIQDDDESEDGGEEDDDVDESDEEENGHQPGAFVKLRPSNGSDEDQEDFEDEQDDNDSFDEDQEDLEDEQEDDDSFDEEDSGEDADQDYSLGDFLGNNRTDSQKLLDDENRQESVQKGASVQNQLKIWEKLLEIRIKLQSSLVTANSYPHPDRFKSLHQDAKFKEATDTVVKTVESTLENLLEMQEILVGRFPESKDAVKPGSKRKLKHFKSAGNKIARVDEFESLIREPFVNYKPYRNEVIQKWHDRTNAASNVKNAHQSLNILKKIENALFSKEEVIRKTQLYRGGYRLFNQPVDKQPSQEQQDEEHENGEPQPIYDGEIFDDSDFYHALLRELIEYKSNTTENSLEINAKLAELQRLRNKMKKQVDTRASKGRKIRYIVHKKLVNFTAPSDGHHWTDDAKNELFGSLFGGTSS